MYTADWPRQQLIAKPFGDSGFRGSITPAAPIAAFAEAPNDGLM
jgi:hypothetical protein